MLNIISSKSISFLEELFDMRKKLVHECVGTWDLLIIMSVIKKRVLDDDDVGDDDDDNGDDDKDDADQNIWPPPASASGQQDTSLQASVVFLIRSSKWKDHLLTKLSWSD